ncbi:TPR-like protein [Athelia psychrophila]|uniref:TPR-like protein n=1 Tax=Athelia psychrophila TaxID=1759441 RepID=A0A166J329_9AGAM|nr:TPR-like protein [Fibularhizoctonia sp. CBS 109695]
MSLVTSTCTAQTVSQPSSSLSAPPPSQPLAPDIWFGRGGIVSTLAEVITGHENPRIAILGSGGMGKTATALHLIRNEAVVARYGDRIFFVACDAATSADLLASRILQTIGVAAAAGENVVTAMHIALKAAPPTLLVLDNFESTWEALRDHAAIRDLLQKIVDCHSSTLIITMRATIAPPGIRWTYSDSLPPLSAPSAKEVFLAINATFCNGSDDGNVVLDELLKELDYVPLAIHLLAHVSKDLTPRYALQQWQKQRTRMLSLDRYTSDKLESVDVSISLSMDLLHVERDTEAIQLLGMLCLLPDGLLGWQERLEVIEETFDTATADLRLLRKFALVYTVGGKLGVLSPIRHFVLQHHHPDVEHTQCMYDILWQLVHTYAMVSFGPELQGAIETLTPEMGNIASLIDHAVARDHGEPVVDIVIKISWHLCYTHPSSHLLHKVSGLLASVPTEMQAEYWYVSGEMMYGQSEYLLATSMLMQARDLFLVIGDRGGAAECSESLGENLRMQDKYSEAAVALKDAQAQFFELGDRSGATRCSKSLGQILHVQRKYSEATAIFTNARAEAVEIGDQLGAAQCSQSLGDNLRMQSEDSEATAVLTDARAQFLDIGERLGAAQCSKSLGNILSMQSNYSEAAAILTNARAELLKIGERLGAAQCSRALGDNLRMQSEYSEAATVLTDARAQFLQINNPVGAAQCKRSLGRILLAQCRYSEAAAALKDAQAQFFELGDRSGAARCSQSLGEILHMQSKYSEATAIFTNARAEALEIGDRLVAAQCSRSLGDNLSMQSEYNYSEAAAILTNARAEFLEIGERLGAAQCSLELGDNLLRQNENSEAAAVLIEARAQLLQINDRMGEAQCARSLGRILLAQRKYTEAETLFRHARDQFLDIGLEPHAAQCSDLLAECTDDSNDGESTDESDVKESTETGSGAFGD